MRKYQKQILICLGVLIGLFLMPYFVIKDLKCLKKSITSESQTSVIVHDTLHWKTTEIQTDDLGGFQKIHFLNEHIGYATNYIEGSSNFFRTSNGGISWVNICSFKDFFISDFIFVSESEGFFVGTKLIQRQNDVKNEESLIMKTVNGGEKWLMLHSSVDSIFKRIIFNSNNIGVVVGNTKSAEFTSKNLILISKKNGLNWMDSSDNLNQVAIDSNGLIDQGLNYVSFSKNNSILTLSRSGRIYSSKNLGETWEVLINGPSEQSGLRMFGELEDNSFWILGGSISIEGKWATIALTEDNCNWKTFRLEDYYLHDVKIVSNNELIAVGSSIAPGNFGGDDSDDRAVILYSSNRGKDWQIIYQSEITTRFLSVSTLNEQKFIILGNSKEGVIIDRN